MTPPRPKRRRQQQSRSGCFFLLTVGLLLIGLLVLNTLFVKTFFGQNYLNVDQRVFTALQFIVPIAMIFIEFWIYDAVVDYYRYGNTDELKDDR